MELEGERASPTSPWNEKLFLPCLGNVTSLLPPCPRSSHRIQSPPLKDPPAPAITFESPSWAWASPHSKILAEWKAPLSDLSSGSPWTLAATQVHGNGPEMQFQQGSLGHVITPPIHFFELLGCKFIAQKHCCNNKGKLKMRLICEPSSSEVVAPESPQSQSNFDYLLEPWFLSQTAPSNVQQALALVSPSLSVPVKTSVTGPWVVSEKLLEEERGILSLTHLPLLG